jgi:hypothetical protein
MFPSKRPTEFPTSETNRIGGERLQQLQRQNRIRGGGGHNNNEQTGLRQNKLYNPTIYSYMCHGKFYASSETTKGSEGLCHGLKSTLEMLHEDHQPSMMTSRAQALKFFTRNAADAEHDLFQETEASSLSSNSELNQRAKVVFLSPALIYKETESEMNHQLQPVGIEDNKTVNHITNSDSFPEEELIIRQDWTCYGSTEVEVLVLQDVTTGEKKITAVAPRNTGLSFREIETQDSLRMLTRIGLGWLDIIHDNNATIMDESTASAEDDKRWPEEVPPKPSIDTIAVAQQFAIRTFDFSKLVAEHMKFNLQWLGSNLQDDFPARTYAAGQNIVAQLPKAVDLTVDTMGKILNRMFGGDDEDED